LPFNDLEKDEIEDQKAKLKELNKVEEEKK
jgi:hypothetical protein